MAATIFYDGECPFCTKYVSLLKLRETVGPVALVNLREDAEIRAELASEGFDLDQGMVVDLDGRRVGGAAATNLLAGMSTPSGAFNRLNRLVFNKPLVSAIAYPVLRSGRWLTLFLMGRRTINDEEDGRISRQGLFGLIFAMFSLFHVFNYIFEYTRVPAQWDFLAIFVAALVLLSRPASPRALFFLMLVSTISTIAQAPATSNHTMLRSMVLIGYWLSFFYACVRGLPVASIFANFILAGRGSLLVMYVYGIFHKINTDFLDPEVSCAIWLWDQMLPPFSWIQHPLMDYTAIYATFIVEGIVMLALIVPRARYWGMALGISFHMFLALSNYSAYISFTTLTISLHVLFLSAAQIDRINASSLMGWLKERAQKPTNKLAFLILLFVGGFAMSEGHYNLASLSLLPTVIVVCFMIMREGRDPQSERNQTHSTAAYVIGTFVTALYFVNGALPYAGLKTAQTVNMFSNLRLEGGVSNHLLFTQTPSAFGYLEDVAIFTGQNDDPVFGRYQQTGFGMVYYELLGRLADHPEARVSFTMNGQTYVDVGGADLQDDIEKTLHPAFVRKWFHFRPVQLDRTAACQ